MTAPAKPTATDPAAAAKKLKERREKSGLAKLFSKKDEEETDEERKLRFYEKEGFDRDAHSKKIASGIGVMTGVGNPYAASSSDGGGGGSLGPIVGLASALRQAKKDQA
mgnify:CR=1 FL=1